MTTRFTLLRSTLAITVAAIATLVTVASSAAPAMAAEGPRSIAIDVSGINLASPAGQARIQAQIGRAARSVCSTGDDRSAANAMARRACIKASVAGATPVLDSFAAAARAERSALADATPATTQVLR